MIPSATTTCFAPPRRTSSNFLQLQPPAEFPQKLLPPPMLLALLQQPFCSLPREDVQGQISHLGPWWEFLPEKSHIVDVRNRVVLIRQLSYAVYDCIFECGGKEVAECEDVEAEVWKESVRKSRRRTIWRSGGGWQVNRR